MGKILIIEDDKNIRDELSILLSNAGYQVHIIEDFTDVLAQIKTIAADLVLLDVGLPEQDGFSLCADIRRTSKVPILFVTSHSTSMDELKALSFGGDDFIAKPYNVPVLIARIGAILRRTSKLTDDALQVKGLSLHLSKSEIEYGGKTIEITRNEAKILWCLMQKPENVVSRADMIETLWDNQVYVDDNTLSVNITRLRSKLEELGLEDYIKTIRGAGYKI